MAGNNADDLLVPVDHSALGQFTDAGDRCRGCRFYTDPLFPGKVALHTEDLIIGHRFGKAPGLADRYQGLLGIDRRPDPYRSCNGFGLLLRNYLG